MLFFFTGPAPPELYALSLHDALPILTTIVLGELHINLANLASSMFGGAADFTRPAWLPKVAFTWFAMIGAVVVFGIGVLRSEEHTSELQSQSNLVCRLLLEKKK